MPGDQKEKVMNRKTISRKLPFRCRRTVRWAAIAISMLIAIPVGAGEADLPGFALQPAVTVGFDSEPHIQAGLLVDGYLRLLPRFSIGLRIGAKGTENAGFDPPIIPQLPLALLFTWDIPLPGGRVFIPVAISTGVTFLPAFSKEIFIEMAGLETGMRIRLTRNVQFAVLTGARALMYCNLKTSGYMPHADFHLIAGPFFVF